MFNLDEDHENDMEVYLEGRFRVKKVRIIGYPAFCFLTDAFFKQMELVAERSKLRYLSLFLTLTFLLKSQGSFFKIFYLLI